MSHCRKVRMVAFDTREGANEILFRFEFAQTPYFLVFHKSLFRMLYSGDVVGQWYIPFYDLFFGNYFLAIWPLVLFTPIYEIIDHARTKIVHRRSKKHK